MSCPIKIAQEYHLRVHTAKSHFFYNKNGRKGGGLRRARTVFTKNQIETVLFISKEKACCCLKTSFSCNFSFCMLSCNYPLSLIQQGKPVGSVKTFSGAGFLLFGFSVWQAKEREGSFWNEKISNGIVLWGGR